MTLVRKNHEVHQRGKECFELVVLLLAEAGVEKRFDAADDAGCGDGGLRRRAGKQGPGLLIEAPREVVEELDAAPDRRFTGSPRLDYNGAGGVGFAAGETQQRFEAISDPISPDV